MYLELLIKLVKTPYFTEENVQKEQGIIAQEIKMYDDDPSFSVYFNALRAMYNTNPVRIDIAGTVDSIDKATRKLIVKVSMFGRETPVEVDYNQVALID